MADFNIHHAKTHLSRLLRRVAAGEEVVISNAGKPIARLVPYASVGAGRTLGTEAGRIEISADFDAPLPDEILDGFAG